MSTLFKCILLLMVGVGLSLGNQRIGFADPTSPAPPDSVEINEALYFVSPGGDPIQVQPGQYKVEIKETWLQLTPTEGERFDGILIDANELAHEEDFSEPSAFLASSSDKYQDIQHVALYLPNGVAYEAMGSQSGVWPRWGWSSIKKAAKKVGSGVKRGGRAVGSGVKKGATAVGSGVKRGAKAVGGGVKRGAQAVGSGVKKGARAIVAAGKFVRNQ
ncbi:MAG: hypothetical protein OET79_01115, partial [Nitrospirota bacterium]|nr:hypothetical protein [Nitrospirota bacterium]